MLLMDRFHQIGESQRLLDRTLDNVEVGEEACLPGYTRVDGSAYTIPDKEHLLIQAETILLPRRERRSIRNTSKLQPLLFIVCCVALVWLFRGYFHSNYREEEPAPTPAFNLVKSAAPLSPTAVLEVFQVYQPVLTPSGATDETTLNDGLSNTTTMVPMAASSSCEVLMMDHSFGYSYGVPYVGTYTPPGCKFNRVVMNFTVTSKGRQFDRLALMFFNDTEVWRTSTAEPTIINGIEWTYMKDMSEYLYFWNSPQKLIFDLGNLIDSTYTAAFNTTLTATFFTSQDTVDPAALIIPISARHGASDIVSVFTLPSDNATSTVSLPRNINRAVFSVSACGQATEEFWWSNVLQSNIDTFEAVDGTLYGYSPFREVQILIDGTLAGVSWPFPIIFTGGIVPGLWRPIVGIDAYDLREHEIDITPFLPILCDGLPHTFDIRVAGLNDNGGSSATITETVGSSWYVTGKIFLWLDSATSITTGTPPLILLPSPVISVSQSLIQNSIGANETLSYTTSVQRTLSISSTINTQSGSHLSSWTQTLSYSNYGLFTDYGAVQLNNLTTIGMDQSTGPSYYKSSYIYPLYANTSYLVLDPVSGNFTIDATIIRGLDLEIQGDSVFPTGLQPFANIPRSAPLVSGFFGTKLSTTQNGSAHYFGSPSAGTSSGFGSTSQVFEFSGIDNGAGSVDTELYYRDVSAVNGTVVKDKEIFVGVEVGDYSFPVGSVSKGQMTMGLPVQGPKQAIGRGPGGQGQVLVQGGGR